MIQGQSRPSIASEFLLIGSSMFPFSLAMVPSSPVGSAMVPKFWLVEVQYLPILSFHTWQN